MDVLSYQFCNTIYSVSTMYMTRIPLLTYRLSTYEKNHIFHHITYQIVYKICIGHLCATCIADVSRPFLAFGQP